MYIRIFGIKAWLRYICYSILLIYFLCVAGAAIYTTAVCQPNRKILDLVWLENCIDKGLAIGVWNGSVAVFFDIIIFILPLPVLLGLQIPRSRKIGLVAVFMFGFL